DGIAPRRNPPRLAKKMATEEKDQENQKPTSENKKRKVSKEHPFPVSPPHKKSPITLEKRTFSKARTTLAALPYPVFSPIARKILLAAVSDPVKSHLTKTLFEGKTIYYDEKLWNWDDEVLTKDSNGHYILETNLDRALRGLCPIAYKGITKSMDVGLLDEEQIKFIIHHQRKFNIHLHHLTQKDTNEESDPLVTMTQTCHMGRNACIILEDDEDGSSRIIHSDLSLEEAQTLCLPSQRIVTNLLHFRRESSLIDRSKFGGYKQAFWQMKAQKEIDRRLYTDGENHETLPLLPRKLVFDNVLETLTF
ncbi:MAG: hypothetical protein K2W92_04885, partial [Alphaproteobacteria bacterium]|nr:hypothetical protein [Alphaproteobacteria bacterium]